MSLGSSSVFFWPGYFRMSGRPKYYNKEFTVLPNVTASREAIDNTIKFLELDDSLNFMTVYVYFPDPVGHASGFKSPQVKLHIRMCTSFFCL